MLTIEEISKLSNNAVALRYIRYYHGLTAAEVCYMLEISMGSLRSMEADARGITEGVRKRFCKKFGISMIDFERLGLVFKGGDNFLMFDCEKSIRIQKWYQDYSEIRHSKQVLHASGAGYERIC